MSVNKKSLKNLKPFKKGVSGNLKGGPKGPQLKTIMAKMATLKVGDKNPYTGEEVDQQTMVNLMLWDKAKNGDRDAMKTVFEYLEGRPSQEIKAEVSHKIEKIEIEFIKPKGE